jgi:transcriptional regulator
MYIPTAFAETDQRKLHDFLERHAFGLLVSPLEGSLFATHVPFLLERDAGPHGCLLGHVARANPHWHGLHEQDVLVVFPGPHAYVSPAWYESENVVPTWNYVAVHAYGRCRLLDDPEAVGRLLARMVAYYEGGRTNPWSLDTTADAFPKMVRGVVGLRIDIIRLEGKWKLNQNHPRQRREKVARALAESPDPDARAVAQLLTADLEASDTDRSGSGPELS